MITLAALGTYAEVGTFILALPFMYLSWASGYIELLWKASRARNWGFPSKKKKPEVFELPTPEELGLR